MTALYDGQLVAEDAPLFSPSSRAVRYGDGVFETLRAYDGRPFGVTPHLERLRASAEWARMAPVEDAVLAAEIEQVSQSIPGDAAVRVSLLRGEGPTLREAPTHRLVMAEPLPAALASRALRSGTAIVAGGEPVRRHRDGRCAKYMRYLPNLLALDEARARGAEEALVCDPEGRIVEGATSNVFVVTAPAQGSVLVTPPESSGILAGVTRAFVLRLAGEANMRVQQRPIDTQELELASELFITSSLREVCGIVRVGSRPVGDGIVGPFTRRLFEGYRALTA